MAVGVPTLALVIVLALLVLRHKMRKKAQQGNLLLGHENAM